METNVSFYTNVFESKNRQPHFINDRCFGEDLANWLSNKLKADFSVSETYQEDWGWQMKVETPATVLISIGIMDDSIGSENAEWQITVEQAQSWFSFKKPDSNLHIRLCNEIEKILLSEKKITRIKRSDCS